MGRGSASKHGHRHRGHRGEDPNPMAEKLAARVGRISNAQDAGFEGQDAFMAGDDEVSFGDHGRSSTNARDIDILGSDLQDEVLSLGTLDDNEATKGQKRAKKQKGSTDAVARDTDGDADTRKGLATSKRARTFQSDRAKDLLPLTGARTSRFQKPQNSTGERGSPAAATDDSDESSIDDTEQDVDEDEDDGVGEWAKSGGFHVSKAEIRRAEERSQQAGSGTIAAEEEDQRMQLELQESRKVQSKSREELEEDDYGIEELETTRLATVTPRVLPSEHEDKNESALIGSVSRSEAIAHLVARDPVLLSLLDDFAVMSERIGEVKQQMLEVTQGENQDQPTSAFIRLYHELLVTYLATSSYYLHLRSHPAYKASSERLGQQVLARLAKLRAGIATLEDLGVVEFSGVDGLLQDVRERSVDSESLERFNESLEDMDEDELEALLRDQETDLPHPLSSTLDAGSGHRDSATRKKRKANRAERKTASTSPSGPQGQPEPRSKRRRKASRAEETVGLLNLDAKPAAGSQTLLSGSAGSHFDDDLVDPVNISAEDAQEKDRRKKSLRFYTSKIDAKSAKRASVGKHMAGGDDDIPYRSKERARAAVLQRQQHTSGDDEADLLDREDDPSDLFAEGDERASSTDDYYELVGQAKRARKAAKEVEYQETALAERDAYEAANSFDPSNPRAVNRMIMANKGLTPKRPKSVRNPRVKKRLKYEKAQKKVASMKPVYKGGLGNTAYEGEKSGISSRVVKSRSL